jgi:hypothetical protein
VAYKFAIGLIALASLAACGGGATDNEASPQAAVTALRAKALAIKATGVSSAEAARQLMDFAESSIYKSYFPGHPVTQSLPPFLYRYYPATGVYLGVASGNDPTYRDGVYTMGGPFGSSPVFQGQVTDFITPQGGSGDPTGPNNGCHNLSLMDTAGTHLVLDMEFIGQTNGSQHVDSTVGAVTGFEGHALAREIRTRTSGTTVSEGRTIISDLDLRSYARKTGDAELTEYGSVLASGVVQGALSGTFNTKIVWVPPFVDKRYALAEGASYTYTQTGTSTSSTAFAGLPSLPGSVTPVSLTSTVTFVRREVISVPAGTYNTCVFQSRSAGSAAVSTEWVVVGRGVQVKTESRDETGTLLQTTQATAVSLNGAPL